MVQEKELPDKSSYSRRIEKEIENYKSVKNVHDLPEIFHYWSNKYILPIVRQFGFHNPKEFYRLYMTKVCNTSKRMTFHFTSIGSASCHHAVDLVEKLLESGIDNFIFECLDINQEMLERGKALAREKNIMEYMILTNADINSWQPQQTYHIVIANQALHHFLELEVLFDKVYNVLHPDGYFLTSDMIGRNGHMRWPEALTIVNGLWRELPDKYKYNHQLKRLETEYDNWDCSKESFEGIRAQDILHLLIRKFKFDLFLAFGNVIDVFVDRNFGHNFDPNDDWDKAFIDKVHNIDVKNIEEGTIKPTKMIAAMTKKDSNKTKIYKHLTPEGCVRWPT